MNIALVLQGIAKFAPVVLAGVVAVENTFASEVPGASKKQIVLDMVQSAAHVGEQFSEPTVQLISALIDSTVGALNKTGEFAHKTPAPAPAQ